MTIPAAHAPYQILLDHTAWSMHRLLTLAESLTPEQFTRPFPIGPASRRGLHDILGHAIGALGRWCDRIAGREPRHWLVPPPTHPTQPHAHQPNAQAPTHTPTHTPADLRRALAHALADLQDLLPSVRDQPGRVFSVTFDSRPYAFTAAAAYLHALTHATYHRAQCMNVLRHLNIQGLSNALPDLDLFDWQAAGEPPAHPHPASPITPAT